MAFNTNMQQAVPGTSASSAEYNKLISNLLDLNTRLVSAIQKNTTQDAVDVGLDSRIAVLESSSGISPVVHVVRNTTNQPLAVTTETPIEWTATGRNPNGMWSATNPTRITVPTGQGGLYLFDGAFLFAANGTGGRTIHIRKNGAGGYYRAGSIPGVATMHAELNISYPMELAAGDYVEFSAWHNSNVSLNLLVLDGSPTLSARRIA